MTGDEYMALLLERQSAWLAEHPVSRPSWVVPLLEWFIRDGDELLFTPPPEFKQPKRETKPRVYRSSASLREERDRLIARRDPLLAPLLNDRAAAGGVGLGPKRNRKIQERESSRLRKYGELTKRIDILDARMRRAEWREKKAAQDA